MSPIRVLVVDDSAVIRRLLTTVIDADPAIDVVGTAPDGRIALTKIEQLRPDIVTLDVEMPNLNGIETLREIRRTNRRIPVIMFSTLTEQGASATIEALSLGASDYVTKPSNTGSIGLAMDRVRDEIVPKIKALCPRGPRRIASTPPAPRERPSAERFDIVAIGASTGGPSALQEVLSAIPSTFPVPIVITQHMPPLFTRQLATRLDNNSQITVSEAADGMLLRPGTATVAAGDFHLTFRGTSTGRTAQLSTAPPENFCRPSVDVMLRSLDGLAGTNVLMVMLTGMGHDGAATTKQLRDHGAWVIAQDETSSVVWGMPGAVVTAGAADEILPLDEIGPSIVRRVTKSAPRPAAHV